MVDFKKLSDRLTLALANETKESFEAWLFELRIRSKKSNELKRCKDCGEMTVEELGMVCGMCQAYHEK